MRRWALQIAMACRVTFNYSVELGWLLTLPSGLTPRDLLNRFWQSHPAVLGARPLAQSRKVSARSVVKLDARKL
jgi:hypothetical protein